MTYYSQENIKGVREIISNVHSDNRGSFANLFRVQDPIYASSWQNRDVCQVNLSTTSLVGSIRGLHMQKEPYSEAKIVRCLSGSVWDVAVDLRPKSSTYLCWHAIELSSSKNNAFLIPEGCAHGFQVLEPNSKLLYIHSKHWYPEMETGIRWDDPVLSIPWPLPVADLSTRDKALPLIHQPS